MFRLLNRFHKSQRGFILFARFAIVGATIFLIDATLWYLLSAIGLNDILSRVISLSASVTAGYFLNRSFTFHHVESGRQLWQSLLRHYSANSIGSVVNIGVYKLVLLLGHSYAAKLVWDGNVALAGLMLGIVAIWVGGMIGMSVNFFFSKKLVFND